MLSAIAARAAAQSVRTSASGVPVSVTWRAVSRAPVPPAQRTRSAGPVVRPSTEDSTRGAPSSASAPSRASAARSWPPPRRVTGPVASMRLAVPASASAPTVRSRTREAGFVSVRPPVSSVTPSPEPATVSSRPPSLSAEAARTSPSSMRSSSTASANASATVARGSQPARVKPTQ